MKKRTFLVALFWVGVGIISRFIPHPPNFTAIGAMAIYSSYTFENPRIAIFLPLVAMLFSDLFFGFHKVMPFVYGAFLFSSFLGFLLRRSFSTSKLYLYGLGSSLFFFFFTNLGVFLVGNLYPKTWEGLVSCYLMAVPFLHYELLGTWFYITLFHWGSYFLFRRWQVFPSTWSFAYKS